MKKKTKSGRVVEVPTTEDDVAINAGIERDPDAEELGEEFFRNARPASEVLPELLAEDVAAELLGKALKRPVK